MGVGISDAKCCRAGGPIKVIQVSIMLKALSAWRIVCKHSVWACEVQLHFNIIEINAMNVGHVML